MKNIIVLFISLFAITRSYSQNNDEITKVFGHEVNAFTENIKNLKEKYVFAYNHLSDELDKYPYYVQLHKKEKPAVMSGIFKFLSFVGKVATIGAALVTGPAAAAVAAGTGVFALFTEEINNAWEEHWEEMEKREKDGLAREGLKAKEYVIDERLKFAVALSRMTSSAFTDKLWKEFIAASPAEKEKLWDQLVTLNENLRAIIPVTEAEAVLNVYEHWIISNKGYLRCYFHLNNSFKIEWHVTAVNVMAGKAITSGLYRLYGSNIFNKRPFDLKVDKVILFTYPTKSGKRGLKPFFIGKNNIIPYFAISDPYYHPEFESGPPKNIPIHELSDAPGELFISHYGSKVKTVHTGSGNHHVWRIKSDVINNLTPTVSKQIFEQYVYDKDYFINFIEVK